MNISVHTLASALPLTHLSIRRSVLASALVLASASFGSHAESFKYPDIEDDRPGGFTVTPMIGAFNLDDDRGLDDKGYGAIGLGYRFSEPYAVEFVYIDADAETTAGADAGDLRQFRLEMLYDVAEYGNWTPYVAVGVASSEFGTTTTTTADDEGAMTFGLGTHYSLTDRIALRLDSRYLKGVDNAKGADVSLALGLNIFLGEVKKPAVVESAPVIEPAQPTLAELCAEAGGILEGDASCVKKSLSTERVSLNVQFENNSDQIQSAYVAEVKKLADFMNAYPDASVVIEGHTDSRGDEVYNQGLSQRRVNEVVRMLSADYGVDASRMSAIGYGETQPVAANDTAANRAKNRRVVASITVELEETIPLNIK